MNNHASSSASPWNPPWNPVPLDDELQEDKEEMFMIELEKAHRARERHSFTLDEFMEEADDHPPLAWLHAFQKRGNFFYDLESGLTKLLNYPDVLQRVLLRDSYLVLTRGDPYQKKGGALHAAVMGGSRDLIELLAPSNSVKAHKRVFFALRKALDLRLRNIHVTEQPGPGFQIIRRALLWRHVKKFIDPLDVDRNRSVTIFLKEFSRSVMSAEYGDRDSIHRMIGEARDLDIVATRIQGEDISADPWGVVLLWAAACGKRYIIEAFKDLQGELFKEITENVERCKMPKFADQLRHPEAIVNDEISSDDLIYLLERTMAMDEGDDQGRSSTMSPCFHDLPKGIVQARFDLFHQTIEEYRWTPLHLAVAIARGNSEVVKCLLTAYPMEGSDGRSLELSRKDDQCLADLRKRLTYTWDFLDEGFVMTPSPFADSFGMTPLHYAVLLEDDSEMIVQMLLRSVLFRPYINDSDIFRRTALHVACDRNATAVKIKALARNTHIDVNAQDCCLFTPLHSAVYAGATNAGRCLLGEALEKIRSTEDRHGNHQYKMAVHKRIKETGKRNERKGTETEREVENGKTTELEHLLLQHPQVKQEVERLYRDRQVFVDAANAILVGAALIASVTFAGWLQPPLGDEEEKTFQKVRVYWVFNSLSFFFSIATLAAGAGAVLPVDAYIEDAVASIRRWLVLASVLLLFCILFVLGAFASAGFASLSSVPHLDNHMIITTSLGSTLCAIIGILFLQRLGRIRPAWLTTEKLLSKIQGIYNRINTGPARPDSSRFEFPTFSDLCAQTKGHQRRIKEWHDQWMDLHVHSSFNSQKCRDHARSLDSNTIDRVRSHFVSNT